MKLKVDSKGYPILDQFSEDGFVDCVLKMTELIENDKTYKFHLCASYDGSDLGFNVEVIKDIRNGLDSDAKVIAAHVYKKGVKFFRSGPESDLFVNVLASLYGMKEKSLAMIQEETFTCIALHQENINMQSETIKIKLFGRDSSDDTDSEENYYESFFNLDLANEFVFWNEKDMDYREPLIRGLTVST